MSDALVLIHTAVGVLAAVLLIVRFKINPVISLVLGALYIGLAAGMGVEKTLEHVTLGFGEVMSEVGLLIAFGVLLGSILNHTGAINRLVERLLGLFGPRTMPFALGASMATFLQTIFIDVLIVISAPLARRLAPALGKYGTARIATAMAIGLECGIVFMVPGIAAVTLAGVLSVPLGKMLLFGLLVVIPTVLAAIAIMGLLFRLGFWKPEQDESTYFAEDDVDVVGTGDSSRSVDEARDVDELGGGVAVVTRTKAEAPLLLLMGPLLFALLLIATGGVLEILGINLGWIQLISSPVVALLIGLIGSIVVAGKHMGFAEVENAITTGFRESGQILLLTGVGGSLAKTVSEAGLGEILGGFFTAGSFAPLLIVWGIAAILHIAVGSVTLSAITAAGLLAPVAVTIGLDPVLIALAAGAGSLFMVHVTSNTFWLLQSLLGQTVRGALKSVSVGVSVASIVAMGPILVLSLFL